jgi:hypothetical protein
LWLLLVLLATASGVYAWRTFPASYPLLDLDVRMSRGAALAAADSIAARLGLGPADARRVAVFQGDAEAQTFIELEGGGPDAFRELVRSGAHRGWQWEVRRFQPGEVHEATIFLDPDGRPAGFRERIPEEAPGAALEADSARTLALATAASAWGVEPGAGWIERPAAVEARPAGRLDHTFTWEQEHEALGEGRFRLRMVVTGDRLSELTRSVHVPEAFDRRYRAIRAANEGLALGANVAMVILYGVGGIIVGLVVLARRQRLHARPALGWAAALAALVTAGLANWLPLSWSGYDTAVPEGMFLFQQLGLAVASMVGLTLMFGASFLGGENLARAAFGRHPYLWGVFSREAGGSSGMLRRVLIGMLLTPVFLGYMVAFGVLTRDWTGWWNPITPLIEPNLIATPLPWLEVIAVPLQAAVWEELLFRAVPFGAAMLLARRFGGRGAWLAAAMVVQAVVFAAAHANYPAQPAHARLVELLLPSVLFGVLFLRWGLVPAIVLHFEYNLVLFALPIFATPADALLGSKAMVVLAGLSPLIIVLLRRAQAGAWHPLPERSRNAAHLAPPATRAPGEELASSPVPPPSPPARSLPLRGLVAVSAVGLAVWAVSIATRPEPSQRVSVSRSAALAVARDTLSAIGVETAEWTIVARLHAGIGDPHRYIWQRGGPAVFDSLLGRYLPAPRWEVSLRRHEAEVAERAEEWQVMILGDGRVSQVVHRLPEGRAGAFLDEASARLAADSALWAAYGIATDSMELVAAVPTERPARRDWVFTWAHPPDPRLGDGRLRVEIELGGGEVVRTARSVHVPETWQRERRASAMQRLLPGFFGAAVLGGLWLAGSITGLMRWSRGTLARERTLAVGALVMACTVAMAANGWLVTLANFTTSEPVALQRIIALVGAAFAALFMGGAAGLLAGLPLSGERATGAARWIPGLALGAAVIGLRSLIGILGRGDSPRVGNGGPLDEVLPLAAPALSATAGLGMTTALLVAVAWAWDASRKAHGVRRSLGIILLAGTGLMAAGAPEPERLSLIAASLVAGVAVVWWGLHHALPLSRAVPVVAAATIVAAGILRDLVTDPWPGSRLASLLALAAVVAGAWWLVRLLERGTAAAPTGTAAAPPGSG